MNFILDLAIIAIIAITIYFAAKNGFVKTAISAVSFILAIALTAMFASPLADYIKSTAIGEKIETTTEEAITNALVNTSEGIDGLLEGGSEDFNKLIAISGLSLDEISDWYDNNVIDTENGESALAKRIAEPIINIIATAIAVVILFIGILIALAIISRILNLVAKLPIIRTANKLLGILLGVILALLRACLFCFVMSVLLENSAFLNSEFLSSLDAEKTLLFKFFSEIDVFSFFI